MYSPLLTAVAVGDHSSYYFLNKQSGNRCLCNACEESSVIVRYQSRYLRITKITMIGRTSIISGTINFNRSIIIV